MFDVPPIALRRAIAAARLAIGRGRWWLIVLYSMSCGPTATSGEVAVRGRDDDIPDPLGMNIIAVYLAPMFVVVMPMM